MPPSPNLPAAQGLDPEIMKQFIALQTKQVEQEATEAEVRKHETETNARLATLTIEANERLQTKAQANQAGAVKHALWFLALVALIVAFLAGYAMYRDKDDLLKYLITAILGAFGGGGVGYAAGKSKQQ